MTVHSVPLTSSISGWDSPPVLLVAASEKARRKAEEAIEQCGLRCAAVSAADVSDRLQLQGDASAVWVELEGDEPALDDLFRDPNPWTRFPLIVASPLSLVDPVMAALADRPVDVLIDPDIVERVTSLSLATAGRGFAASVQEVSGEPSAARLRQLSDEVGRIAATLARLSTGPAAATVELPVEQVAEGAATVNGEQVRAVIRARRLRARFFDAELFADPAWDMLLDLFQAEIAQHRVPVSSLCIAASVPPTTALRWIKTMTDAGLFHRRADPHDGRRVFVELAPDASRAMRGYFAQVGSLAA